MRKYCAIKPSKNADTDVIRKDTMEMYHISSSNAGNIGKSGKSGMSVKTALLLYAAYLVSIAFLLFLPRVRPEYRIFFVIPAALAQLGVIAAMVRMANRKLEALMDSDSAEKLRFVPTKQYLKGIRKKLVRDILVFFFTLIILVFTLAAFSDGGLIKEVFKDDWVRTLGLIFLPALLYAILTALISDFSGYSALKKYEKIHEDRLRDDGPVVFPAYWPDEFSSYDSRPLLDFVGELALAERNGGYRKEDVDAFLGKLRRDLQLGYDIPAEKVSKITFRKESAFKTGYAMPDVDAALDYIAKRLGEQTDPVICRDGDIAVPPANDERPAANDRKPAVMDRRPAVNDVIKAYRPFCVMLFVSGLLLCFILMIIWIIVLCIEGGTIFFITVAATLLLFLAGIYAILYGCNVTYAICEDCVRFIDWRGRSREYPYSSFTRLENSSLGIGFYCGKDMAFSVGFTSKALIQALLDRMPAPVREEYRRKYKDYGKGGRL